MSYWGCCLGLHAGVCRHCNRVVIGLYVPVVLSLHMLVGLYCSGWVKRGAEGVIVSTMQDAYETAEYIADDLKSGE